MSESSQDERLESGGQQGDTLRSTLFALGNHPYLIKIAQHHPVVLVTGYADKTFIQWHLQAGVTKEVPDFKEILQEANLQFSTFESHLHVTQWATQEMSALADQAQISHESDSHDELIAFRLDCRDTVQLAHQGLQFFDCPAGADECYMTRLDASCSETERDLDLLQDF